MMFKLMVVQRYYNLSDEQAEFQIVDRTSFRRFLGLSDGDRVPDARTIWLFRERLAKGGKVGDLFQKFVDYLNGKGLIFNEGRMIDASFVSVPKQHNTPDENKRIKAGEGEGLWKPETYLCSGLKGLSKRNSRIHSRAGWERSCTSWDL